MADKEMDEWWAERSTGEKVVVVILLAILGVGLLFLFGLVVMWLWNWLMPEIFGLPELSYWQAWGLLILSSILFKDMNFGSDDSKSRRADRKRKRKLREYMREDAAGTEEADRPAQASARQSDQPADDGADDAEAPPLRPDTKD